MEDFNKNQFILILVISNLIFVIATLSLGRQVYKNKQALRSEMNLRFDLEAKEAEFNKLLAKAQENTKAVQRALEEEKATHQETKKILNETRDELEKTTKLKDTLEEDLKEALVKNKKQKNF
ncbi:MAG: hypothetical protein PHH69_03565 [Candidatus Omnitrophica bacterium]|nr:hypothetical protein [Candidatus Omnitrophota bacterium]MDD5610608.1 hypothetical protein [Candidatus Omnitrophota bacterium]